MEEKKSKTKIINRLFIPFINQVFAFFPNNHSRAYYSIEDIVKSKINFLDIMSYKSCFETLYYTNFNNLLQKDYEIYLVISNKIGLQQHLIGEKSERESLISNCEEVMVFNLLYKDLVEQYSSKIHYIFKDDLIKIISKADKTDNENYLDYIFSYEVIELIKIKRDLNSDSQKSLLPKFYILLSNFNLNYYEQEENPWYNNLTVNNILNIRSYLQTNNSLPFDLNCLNFIQHIEIFDEIKDNTEKISNIEKINKQTILDSVLKDKVKVLVFQRTLQRYKDFKKYFFYISSKNVLFKFHIGGDDIKLNLTHDKFDLILCKMGKIDDQKVYKKLLNDIHSESTKHKILNNCTIKLKIFQDKNLMIDLINSILLKYKINFKQKCEITIKNTNDYSSSCSVCCPSNTSYSIQDLLRVAFNNIANPKRIYFNESSFDSLKKFFEEDISKKELSFPLLIKVGGDDYSKHHETWIAMNVTGIIEFMNKLLLNFEDTLILQEYIQSNMELIKGYRIAGKSFFYKRTISIQNRIDSLKKSNYLIEQSLISNSNVFKIEREGNEKLSAGCEQIEVPEYLNDLMSFFEKETEINLFGLDFLYDLKRDKYFLIDCNFFPGYKELITKIPELIVDHCILYHSKLSN